MGSRCYKLRYFSWWPHNVSICNRKVKMRLQMLQIEMISPVGSEYLNL